MLRRARSSIVPAVNRRLLWVPVVACAACGGEQTLESSVEASSSYGLTYQGSDFQFHPSFSPNNAPYGGFGGGSCIATRTPVVFVPGNGDPAKNWDFPSASGVPSVYETFRAAGYNDCELFGINYLSPSVRDSGLTAYHTPARAEIISDFIEDVKAYTGQPQVDVIGHSLGVSTALEGLRQGGLWSSARRFVSIAGGLRGLASCYYAGYANPALPVCGSANWFDSDVYGFYPSQWYAPNPRTGNGGLRDDPRRSPSTRFYALSAGYQDQVACTTSTYYYGCYRTNLFDSRSNVVAQLFVGEGSTAGEFDFDFSDWSPFALGAGDSDGVGHFRAKNNTGAIQVNMLTTGCVDDACCTGYGATCY